MAQRGTNESEKSERKPHQQTCRHLPFPRFAYSANRLHANLAAYNSNFHCESGSSVSECVGTHCLPFPSCARTHTRSSHSCSSSECWVCFPLTLCASLALALCVCVCDSFGIHSSSTQAQDGKRDGLGIPYDCRLSSLFPPQIGLGCKCPPLIPQALTAIITRRCFTELLLRSRSLRLMTSVFAAALQA